MPSNRIVGLFGFFDVELHELFTLGWQKGSFGFSHKMLWKNSNEPFDQLNIFWIVTPYWLYDLQMFSPICRLPSCFAVQKLLSLIRSRLFIFALISFTLGDIQRNIAMIYVRVFCLCFPLGVL